MDKTKCIAAVIVMYCKKNVIEIVFAVFLVILRRNFTLWNVYVGLKSQTSGLFNNHVLFTLHSVA